MFLHFEYNTKGTVLIFPDCFYFLGFFLPFFKNYFSPVIQYCIEFYQNNIIKIKKYFIFIW